MNGTHVEVALTDDDVVTLVIALGELQIREEESCRPRAEWIEEIKTLRTKLKQAFVAQAPKEAP